MPRKDPRLEFQQGFFQIDEGAVSFVALRQKLVLSENRLWPCPEMEGNSHEKCLP
jgi:hypothetical protein